MEVAFDVDLRGMQVRFKMDDVDFPTADAPARQYDQHVLAAAGEAPVFCYAGHAAEAAGLCRVGGAHDRCCPRRKLPNR